jgi:hypothetical protein
MNAAYENPRRIPLLFGGKLWGFLALGDMYIQTIFSVCINRCTSGLGL